MDSKRVKNRLELRHRILNAARHLFAEQGLENTTMAQVAASAGVARATVFNQFSSKQTLLEAITLEILEYFRSVLAQVLKEDSAPVPTLVRALFVHMGKGIAAYHPFYHGMFHEIMSVQLGINTSPELRMSREETLANLTQLFARGQATGEIASNIAPEDLAVAFDSLSKGIIVHWLYEDMSEPLDQQMLGGANVLLGSVATAEFAVSDSPVPDLRPSIETPTSRLSLTPTHHARTGSEIEG